MRGVSMVVVCGLGLACGDKGGDDDGADGSDGGASGSDMEAWVPTSTHTAFARRSDGAPAWDLDPGGCERDGDGLLCTWTVELTEDVGMRCSTCEPQVVEVGLVLTDSGQLLLDELKLVVGLGLPAGVRLTGLGLPLTPEPPLVVGEAQLLGAEVLTSGEPDLIYATFTVLAEHPTFVDANGASWSRCRTLRWGETDVGTELRAGAFATTCAGEGVVQVAIVDEEHAPEDPAEPYAEVDADDLYVRAD